MIQILYIGNNFTEKSKYHSTLTTLSNLLISEGYKLTITSSKRNKVFRLADMCWSVIKNRNKVDYVLIDTFSTSSFYFAFLTSQIARLLHLKYLPILHGGNLPFRLNESSKISKMIFDNSYVNVAPSNYLKSEFEKAGYETTFIPNTIQVDDYKYKQSSEISPKLLWVRAFDKTYNPQMAVLVLNKLLNKYPNATLCMVGPDKDKTLAQVQNLINELKLEDNVTITGVLSKEEWHALSENFNIFINTTNVDNTPLSVIEAMALGLPIISTNVGGLPFLIEDRHDGILVEKNDVNGMTKAIIELLSNTLKTNKFSMNARKKVEKFDWRFVRKEWLNLIK